MEDKHIPKPGEIYLQKGKSSTPYIVLDVTGEGDNTKIHAIELSCVRGEIKPVIKFGERALNRLYNEKVSDDKFIETIDISEFDVPRTINAYEILINEHAKMSNPDPENQSGIDYDELNNMLNNVNDKLTYIAMAAAGKIGWHEEECEKCGVGHMVVDAKYMFKDILDAIGEDF